MNKPYLWMSLLCLGGVTSAHGQTLDVTGACPGTVNIDITGLTPGGEYIIFSGDGPGIEEMGFGDCRGTPLGLVNNVARRTDFAPASGIVTVAPALSGSRCGMYLTVVDTTTCTTSAVRRIPAHECELPQSEYQAQQTFADTSGLEPLGGAHLNLAWTGDALWASSGGASSGVRLAEFDNEGNWIADYSPGLDFRSVFTRGDGTANLFATAFADPSLYRMISPGTFIPIGELVPAPPGDSSVVWNDAQGQYLALSGGIIQRWSTAGTDAGTLELINFGTRFGEADLPQGERLAAEGACFMTYNSGELSVWDIQGERVDSAILLGAGTGPDSHWSFSYARGMAWVQDAGAGTWRGYNLNLGNRHPTLEQDIQPLLDAWCVECHSVGGSAEGRGIFEAGTTWNNVVNVPSGGSALDFIEPFDPDNSYLWHKINGTQGTVGGGGSQMPQGGPPFLDTFALDLFEDWILGGATRGPQYTHARDIQPIFDANCTSGCHEVGGSAEGDLILDADLSYLTTVGVESGQAPMNIIEPGDSDASYLWHKLNDTHAAVGGSGTRMPRGNPPLSADDLDIIQTWIDEGAARGTFMHHDRDIQSIWSTHCVSCHDAAGASGGLVLDEGEAFANLVLVPSSAGLDYVQPGDLEASYLWHKINGTQVSVGGAGSSMPSGGGALSADEIAAIELWILEGALH